MLSVIQMALWWHAAHLADGAAHRAAVAAARLDGDAGEGAAAASSFAAAAGAELVGPPRVERGATTATATVTVEVPSLLPGFPGTVARVSVAPVERFLPEGER